jgi:hypothetical protein
MRKFRTVGQRPGTLLTVAPTVVVWNLQGTNAGSTCEDRTQSIGFRSYEIK